MQLIEIPHMLCHDLEAWKLWGDSDNNGPIFMGNTRNKNKLTDTPNKNIFEQLSSTICFLKVNKNKQSKQAKKSKRQ